MYQRVKQNTSKIVLLWMVIILSIIGYVTITKEKHTYLQDKVQLKENNDIDYKVYLKENDFFQEEYLGKGKAYITSLIDYISVKYKYNLFFDKPESGNYTYYLTGVISADLPNNDNSNYWQKEYILLPEKEMSYTDTKKVSFDVETKINYQEYNDMLLEFKKKFNVSLDGALRVYLHVKNNINGKTTKQVIKDESSLVLTIPLTKATIEVPIKIDTNNKNDILKTDKIPIPHSKLPKAIGYISFVIAGIISFYMLISSILAVREKNEYRRELKRILKTYDCIIVNVKNNATLKGYNVIDVSSFSELIDAHSEVRQPINFYEDKSGAIFVLYKDNMVWRYKLEKR